MTVDRLLVPMDGSPLSKRALRVTLEEYPDAHVTVLHVINPAQPGYSYPLEVDIENEPLHGSEEWYERSEELAEQLFTEVREIAAEYDAEVLTETVVGDPGREIVEFATHHDVDQIVIGGHGRSEIQEFFLGSVAETVVFRASVRVLLIP